MKTQTKNNRRNSASKSVALTTSSNIEVPTIKTSGSFDEMYNRDEKEVDRENKHHMAKNGKKLQLFARINDLKMRITKGEVALAQSLTDPTKDSVELKIELKCMNEELLIAQGLYVELFPEEVIK